METRNLLKSIISVMMVAFCAMSASAQVSGNGINLFDPQQCGEYLAAHPGTVLEGEFNTTKPDGTPVVVKRKVYFEDGELCFSHDTINPPHVVYVKEVPQETLSALDEMSVRSVVAFMVSQGQPQDVIYGNSTDAADYRRDKDGTFHTSAAAGKIPVKWCNKYGLSVNVHAGWSFASGVNGPIGGAGLEYDGKWFGSYLNAEIGKSKYSSNAVRAGENYITYRAEAGVMFRPFQIDQFDQNRLFIIGGIGFESYETDSQPLYEGGSGYSYMSSHGNYLYGTAGLAFEHRFFATGWVLGVRAQWRNTRAAVQNSGDENFGSWVGSVYMRIPVHHNKGGVK